MFTWVPIYQEAALKILEFEDRQSELIDFIAQLHDKGLPTIKLDDRTSRSENSKLHEMDPFSFFANFNRQVTLENRIEILKALKSTSGLQSPIPSKSNGTLSNDNENDYAHATTSGGVNPLFYVRSTRRGCRAGQLTSSRP